MDFIKRYLSIIIPAAILLVAIIFILLAVMTNSKVAEQMDQSISMGSRVTRLASEVPSKEQPAVEAAYQSKIEEDANRIEQLFIETTTRQLIDYEIFPLPVDTSRQRFTDFAQKYRAKIEELIGGMSAVDAPSEAEINGITTGTSAGSRRMRNEETDLIIEAYCKDRALRAKVYASPSILPWFDFWRKYNFVSQKIAVEDSWNSQVAYWVYKDVVETINTLNAPSRSIMDAPVKRLLGVTFTTSADGAAIESARSARTAKSIDTPVYITEESFSPLVMDSWTQRKCNEDIDVIHFSLSVIVGVKDVPVFMKELCSAKQHEFMGWDGKASAKSCKRNQITILKFDTAPIEQSSPLHQYYRYGNGAVVKWTGVCEYVFSRKAYDSIMPESIKNKIAPQEQN